MDVFEKKGVPLGFNPSSDGNPKVVIFAASLVIISNSCFNPSSDGNPKVVSLFENFSIQRNGFQSFF